MKISNIDVTAKTKGNNYTISYNTTTQKVEVK